MSRGTRSGHESRLSTVVWTLGWIAFAGLVVVPHILTYTKLSPIDEYQHIDYFANVRSFELVHGGDQIGETAMREQACRGIDLPGFDLPPCDAEKLTPEQFPGSGYNQTYNDPPTYYVITVPLAEAVDLLPGVDSVVTAARSIGVLWLGLGLALTYFLAIRLGARRWAAVGATSLAATSAVIVGSVTTVTTDAPSLVVGGLLCLVALAVVEGRTPWWWLVPTAMFAMLVKSTSVTVLGAVVVFLATYWLSARRSATEGSEDSADSPPVGLRDDGGSPGSSLSADPGRRSPLVWILAAGLGGGIPILVWLLYANATTTGPVDEIPAIKMFHVDSIGWTEFATEAFSMTRVLADTFVPSFMDATTMRFLGTLLNGLVFAALAGMAWFGDSRKPVTRLAAATLVSMLVSGAGFIALFYFSGGIYIHMPGRYGLSLVPPAVAVLAVAASRRQWGGAALSALSVVSLGVLLSQTL